MKCYDEITLYKYINNDLDEAAKRQFNRHLEDCQICKDKIEELKAFDDDLRKYWTEYRKECLSPNDIHDYAFGKLSDEKNRNINEHLESCHVCRFKINEVKEMVRDIEIMSLADERQMNSLIEKNEVTLLKKIANALSIYAKSNYSLDLLKDMWKAHFTYNKPIALKALAPRYEQIYSGDVGDGYEKDIIQQEDSPFKIEVAQFGKQINVTFQTQKEPFNNSIVRYELREKNNTKYSGIVFISDGIGKCFIHLDKEDLERPEKERYRIVLNVLASSDVLDDIKDPSSSKIIMELMKTGNTDAIRMVTDIIKKEQTEKK